MAAGFAAGALVTTVELMAGVGGHPVAGLIPLLLVLAVVAALTTMAEALVAAAFCWAFYAGFVLNRMGQLGFDERARFAVLAFAVVAVVVSGVAAMARRHVNPFRHVVIPFPRNGVWVSGEGGREQHRPEVIGDGHARP